MKTIVSLKTKQVKKLVSCFVFMLVLLPFSVSAATTVGNNVSVGGTLGVTGATTLTGALAANGNVTLGDAAADSVTLGGYFNVMTVGNLTATSTLGSNYLRVGAVAADVLGKFNVDSSGNVSASGTLGVFGAASLGSTLGVTGATTLTGALAANGNVTLGNAESDSITVTGYITSDLTVFDSNFYIGNGSTTSTFEQDGITMAADSSNLSGLFYVDPSGNVFASGTLEINDAATFLNGLNGEGTISWGGTGTTTIEMYPDNAVGTCFVVKDEAGTQKYMKIKADNTWDISTNDCTQSL